GYRIELGEVEHALQGYPGVKGAVVEIYEEGDGEKYLVGYVVGKGGLTVSELREYLRGVLPGYMVPSYFVELERIPLTTNGKVDRRSLPRPEGISMDTGMVYVGPRNAVEEKLVLIYQEVLKRDKVGIKDD